MVVVIVIGALVLIGIAVGLSLFGDTLEPEPVDSPDLGLPTNRPLTSADVPGLRFRTGLRGYRMADVDAAIASLGEALSNAEQSSVSTAEQSSRTSAEQRAEPPAEHRSRAASDPPPTP
jgi:DivIVA domain-containing protein